MQHTYNIDTVKALVVVSAKEHGKIYTLEEGTFKGFSYTEEHPPTHSDNEGFFTSSSNGRQQGSGNVREEDDEHNLKEYIKAITEDLRSVIDSYDPEVVFIIEPEHLKGKIEEHLTLGKDIPLKTIAYGNYVEKEPEEIYELVRSALTDEHDPADPASVDGEENAAEKRKILEIGKEVSG